jgi:hypothetical protein
MLFTAVLVGYGLCLALAASSNSAERLWSKVGAVVLRVMSVVGFGLGLSCFFWLPALAERDLVEIYQLHLPASLHYSNHFAQLNDLFGLPRSADPSLVYQPRPMSRLHLGAVLLTIAAGVGLWRRREMGLQKSVSLFVLAGTGICVVMALSVSELAWERIPLLPFVQFPGRFIGLGSFFLASSAGAAVFLWRDRFSGWTWLVLAILVLVLALYVVPWQYMRRYPRMDDLTMVDSAQFERQTGLLGTTTTGEFLPNTVYALPEENSLSLSDEGRRLDSTTLPAGAEILYEEYAPQHYELLLESSEAFTAIFHTFDFPGWQAAVDDTRVPITPTDPYGLISVDVPAGQHRLVIEFRSTPIRIWATGISIVSVLALTSVVLWKWLNRSSHSEQSKENVSLTAEAAWSVLIAVIFTLIFKLAYLDREGQQTLWRRTRFDGQSVSGVDIPLAVNFENQLHLLGVDVPAQVASGEVFEVTLYWRAPLRVDQEYSVGLMLVDDRGVHYGQSDNQHPGGYPPTTHWRPEEYAQDSHGIRVLPGTPPGTYTLQVVGYPYGQPGQTLDVLNFSGAPVGRTATMTSVVVTRPSKPPTREMLASEKTLELPLNRTIRLIGYDRLSDSLRAGDILPLTVYWEASSAPETDLMINVLLSGTDGEKIHLDTVPLVVGYPTSRWRAGDRWRGVHRLLLPPTLEDGGYQLLLSLNNVAFLPLDSFDVHAPDHVMSQPAVSYTQSATFGNLASLVGYDLSPTSVLTSGASVSVELVWHVHQQTRTAYKTFVHLIDAEGRRMAGSDQVPDRWQRPTTGWIAGEYIIDVHTVNLPADLPVGHYRLQTGLYEEATSERLPRPDGADTVVFDTQVEVRDDP